MVIECKHHDVAAKDLPRNALQEWERVADKLRRRAGGGWSGHFVPWRSVRTYVYCVGAALPTADLRQALKGKVHRFFSELPPEQRPGLLTTTAVVDWSYLKQWLSESTTLSYWWLGTELQRVVPHALRIEGLSGSRRYLLEDQLPFVQPAADAVFHPGRLFQQLEQLSDDLSDQKGVLLLGAGGVGKTRLSMETAARAVSAGWQVLHVLAGEPAVDVGEILAQILPGSRPTILVFDYLDQMTRLDARSLRDRLGAEARQVGVRTAFLATSRIQLPEYDQLLLSLTLPSRSEYTDEVTQAIRLHLAPSAIAVIGEERVAELCGTRPIVAMFIARELERRARLGKLDSRMIAGFRQGELIGWLHARLAEDELLFSPGKSGLRSDPDQAGSVIAAAAVLAASPQRLDALESAAAAVLDAVGASRDRAKVLLDSLADLGWLEPQGTTWEAAHDVVADEVLEQVLWQRSTGLVRESALAAVLAGAKSSARTLGRMATALGRLLGPGAAPQEFRGALAGAADRWLVETAQELGQTLVGADADEAAYALGAVITSPPWAEAALRQWDELAGSWLEAHGTEREARHLIFRALRRMPALDASQSAQVIGHALRWLELNGDEPEASFVLQGVLEHPGRALDEARAVEWALRWLRRFCKRREAKFVLHALLGHERLGASAAAAVGYAFSWLERGITAADAHHVLEPLVSCPDLGTEEQRSLDLAVQWLATYGAQPQAGTLIARLLAQPHLGSHSARTVQLALGSVAEHSSRYESGYLLRALLGRSDLGARHVQAVYAALRWLQKYTTGPMAGLVIEKLLACPDLGRSRSMVEEIALNWLVRHLATPNAEFLLQLVLGSPQSWLRDRVARLVMDRLEVVAATPEATYLLKQVLRSSALHPKDQARAVRLALEWLDHHTLHPELDFVANRLLRRCDLPDSEWQRASGHLLNWLRVTPHGPKRDHAYNSLRKRLRLLATEERQFLAEDVQRWNAAQMEESSVAVRWDFPVGEYVLSARDLFVLARQRDQHVDAETVRKSAAQARRRLEDGYGRRAGALVAPLLPLAARAGDPAVEAEVLAVAQQVLGDSVLSSRERLAFTYACWGLVRSGSWSNRAVGQRILTELGVEPDPAWGRPRLVAAEELRALAEGADTSSATEVAGEALAQIQTLVEAGHPGVALSMLAALVPLAARLGSDLLDAVFRSTSGALAHPDTTESHRDAFQRACRRLTEAGVWPDSESARVVLQDLKCMRRKTAEELTELALHPGEELSGGTIRAALARAERLVEDHPAAAGHFVAPLLPLADRVGEPGLAEHARTLAVRLLEHPSLMQAQRDAFVRSCQWLVAAGAWTVRQHAEELFAQLGLLPDQRVTAAELTELALRPGGGFDDELIRVALARSEKLIEEDHPAAAGHFVAPLLPLADRVEEPVLAEQARTLAVRLLEHPSLTQAQRVAFVRSSQRLVAGGAWSGRQRAEEVFSRLRLGSLTERQVVAEELTDAALHPDKSLDVAAITAGLMQAQMLLEAGRPAAASHFLVPLLPLADRAPEAGLVEETSELLMRVLEHPSLTQPQRFGLIRSSQSLVERGAWPSRERGEEVLAQLRLEKRVAAEELRDLALAGLGAAEPNVVRDALDQASRLTAAGHPAAAGYFLAPLLPLAERTDRILLERAAAVAARALAHAALTPQQCAGFDNACRYFVEHGAWLSRQTAEEVLGSLGIHLVIIPGVTTFTSAEPLRALALNRDQPIDVSRIQEGLRHAEEMLDAGAPEQAGHFLAPLLPLTARLRQNKYSRKTAELVRRFLDLVATNTRSTEGFAYACYRLLDAGAWPDPRAGEELLEALAVGARGLEKLAQDPEAAVSPERVRRAVDAAEVVISRDRLRDAGVFLAVLLPLAARAHDRGLVGRLHAIIDRFLTNPLLPHEYRDGFARNCRRWLKRGAWPSLDEGEAALETLGIGAPGLDRLLRDSTAAPDQQRLRQALEVAVRFLAGDRPGAARHTLGVLLPLAARVGDSQLEAEIQTAIRTLLEHPQSSARLRERFALNYRNRFESGAWSDPDRGRQILSSLGLLDAEGQGLASA